MRTLAVCCAIIVFAGRASGHEPLYGLGPETLPKHLSAVEFGLHFSSDRVAYQLGFGFGITQNWTVRLDAPAISAENEFGFGNMSFRTKYALWRKTEPGVLKRLTLVLAASVPTTTDNLAPDIATFTLGLANGYESRRWYYFSDIGYTRISSNGALRPGDKLNYNLVGGIRPVKSAYLKPDLVLLIELNGEWSAKSRQDGDSVPNTEGNTLAIAPGFLFSYRNVMLKGGVQFGVSSTEYVDNKQTNGLVSLEYHF